jgi:hypothetical protein
MGIIKNYHDKKWTLQFLDALYNSIDIDSIDIDIDIKNTMVSSINMSRSKYLMRILMLSEL